jgi:hypothetical protein
MPNQTLTGIGGISNSRDTGLTYVVRAGAMSLARETCRLVETSATITAGDKRMKLSKRIAIAALVIAPGFVAPVWSQGTAQQRAACTPDVFRLCSEFIPDPDRITACLASRQQELSESCASVFSPPRSTTSATYPEPTRDRR